MHALTVKAAHGKPVIITETGWPDNGNNVNEAVPSPLNAMKYFINLQTWGEKYNTELFYFSSFDEAWKIHHEGEIGASWGIWDKNEHLKYS